MLNKEQLYTSTQTKLLHNLDRLKEMQKGYFRPISIQLAPTNKCNLNCVMCSVANRDKSDELSLEQSIQVLTDFKTLGAKTVEITGGGDCTLYPYINDIIEFAAYNYDGVGLITNGIRLDNISYKNLSRLTWIRISLNSLDYIEDIDIDIPNNVILGFSYVWTNLSSKDKLEKIQTYTEKYKASYVRIVPNCLSVEDINKSTEMIQPYLDKHPNFFFQQKKYTVPNKCWMGRVKPFVNADGYVYHCSANPLIDRKFNSNFTLCHVDDIIKTWESSYSKDTAFDTCNCQEGKCFFAEHNNLIEQIITPCTHGNFV